MIENRYDRMDYLLETTTAFCDNPQALLEELVRAMSNQEFDTLYQYICRMHDIEPDEEKFKKLLEDSGMLAAMQGTNYPL